VAALGIGGWALFRVLSPNTIETVEVPAVVDLTEEEARTQLTERQLQVEVTRINGEEETTGRVTAQDPVEGTQVNVNSTVTITVNDGPKTATIPDNLVGKDVRDVKNALEDLQFTNIRTVADENADADPGEVTRISPKEGETVPLDSRITVRYAPRKSEVPDFDGVSRAAAIRIANDAGFDDPVFNEQESSQPAGTVIAQNPRAGANVDRDTTIRLTLATAPEPTEPPPTTEQPTDPPTTREPTRSPSPTPKPSETTKTPANSNT
jgi:beta-lactam-binding protein with PASTA domain